MSDDAVRRALANLARSADSQSENGDTSAIADEQATYRETIELATTAVRDLDAAAQFVDDDGLDELERAVEEAERSVSACADDGERALAAFRSFREAAEGDRAGDQFHPGHGTSLGGGDIGPSK